MTMSKRLSDENASFKIIYLHTYTQCTYTYLSIPRFLALFNGLGFIVVEVKKKRKNKNKSKVLTLMELMLNRHKHEINNYK